MEKIGIDLLNVELSPANKEQLLAALDQARETFTWRQLNEELTDAISVDHCVRIFEAVMRKTIGALLPGSSVDEERKALLLFCVIAYCNSEVLPEENLLNKHEDLLELTLTHLIEGNCAPPNVILRVRGHIEGYCGRILLQDRVCRLISDDFFDGHQILFPDAEQHLELGRNVACGMLAEYKKLDPLNLQPLEWASPASSCLTCATAPNAWSREPYTLQLLGPWQIWVPAHFAV